MYFDNAVVSGFLIPNGVDPSTITADIQSPINALNQQMNVLLTRIQNNPTPNQGDILQLQIVSQQYNNLIQLVSSVNKAFFDCEKQVITNMAS
jgi:hypothetical protein